jgi:hypothetical protein
MIKKGDEASMMIYQTRICKGLESPELITLESVVIGGTEKKYTMVY